MTFLLAACAVLCGLLSACGEKKEKESYIWYYPGETFVDSKAVNDAANEIFEKKLGVSVKMSPITPRYYDNKMKLLISSGEDYDICFTSNWTNNFQNNVLSGVFYPITELLEKTPALGETIPDFVWEGTKYNSQVYAVPNYQVLYAQKALIMQNEVAERYGSYLESVNNLEDLEPFFDKVYSENDVKKGLSNDLGHDFWLNNEQIVGAEMFSVKVGDDKVFCSYLVPEYEDYINTMSRFFKKGYVGRDMYSNVQTGGEVVSTALYKPGALKYDENGNPISVKYIVLGEPTISQKAGVSALTAISKDCKDPLTALKVIELVNKDKELYNTMCFGIEGVHYKKETENVITLTGTQRYNLNRDWIFGNQFNAYYTDVENVGSWEETEKINREAARGKLYNFRFDIDKVKAEITMLESIISEYKYLEEGVDEIGNDYNEFKEKLIDAGALRVQEEIQRQIDEFEENETKGM